MPRVLVVDDDRAIVEMLEDLLRSSGYHTASCRDGAQVKTELANGTFDLVLLDVLIPKTNGFSLIEELRQSPATRDLPVIMMSGIYRSRNHRTEMTNRLGVIDYLDKPLDPKALLSLIERTIGKGDPKPVPLDNERTVDKRAVVLTQKKAPPEPPPDRRLVDEAESHSVETAARREFAPSAFLLQGTLKNRPVAGVLGKLWHERATGALLLRSGNVKKIVYMRDGSPTFVKSNLVSECLGQVLIKERLISERECAESLELMKQSGRRQGELLVEMRCLTDKNLTFALELQFETKLFTTFAWDEGEYRFNASAEMPAAVSHPLAGAALITEGIRRAFDETRLRALMLAIFDVPIRLRDPSIDFTPLRLSPAEREAINAMKLPATTRTLVETSPLSPPDALRLLYTLIALELCVPAR